MPYFDRFDIVQAHYVFNVLHHEGQWSARYERQCHIGEYYNPGPLWSENRFLDPDNEESENSREIYLELCEREGEEPATFEANA